MSSLSVAIDPVADAAFTMKVSLPIFKEDAVSSIRQRASDFSTFSLESGNEWRSATSKILASADNSCRPKYPATSF